LIPFSQLPAVKKRIKNGAPKGQLISKGHFGFFNPPKKRNKFFLPQWAWSKIWVFKFVFWENLRLQKDISKLTDG